MNRSMCTAASIALAMVAGTQGVGAAPISILFVGNSYTFGRVDPVLSYNARMSTT